MDIVTLLRNQAREIAEEGHDGWGNTMTFAADEIETLRRHKNELAAQLEAAQQSVQPTYGTLPAPEVYTTPEDLPAPVVRLDPPISG